MPLGQLVKDLLLDLYPGDDPAIAGVRQDLERVSAIPGSAVVLLEGPPGSGKTTMARTIAVCRRRAIRHLRSGVASPSAARMITVGTNAIESELTKFENAWLGGASTPNMAFVLADWGFGKTHLRMLLVDSFLNRRVPFIHDHVDGKSGSLAHLHRTVPRWMESVQLGPYAGIRAIIEEALNDVHTVRSWCWKHGTSFARDLNRAVDGREWAWDLVAGHQYQFPDYSYNHLKAFEILVGSDEQDRVPEAYHERWDRMVAVKSHYDPNNFFRLNQNIPPWKPTPKRS